MLSTDYRPLGVLETLLMQIEAQAVALEQQAKAIRLTIALLRGETSPADPMPEATITTASSEPVGQWQDVSAPADERDDDNAMPPTFGG